MLRVCDVFLPLIQFQPTKIVSVHTSPLWWIRKTADIFTLLRRHYNWPIKIESILQSHREFVLLPACKIKNAATRTRVKINHFMNFLTHRPVQNCLKRSEKGDMFKFVVWLFLYEYKECWRFQSSTFSSPPVCTSPAFRLSSSPCISIFTLKNRTRIQRERQHLISQSRYSWIKTPTVVVIFPKE